MGYGFIELVAMGFMDRVITPVVAQDHLVTLGPISDANPAAKYDRGVDSTVLLAGPGLASDFGPSSGSFMSDYCGTVTVTAEDDVLVIRWGPDRISCPMRHYGYGVFRYQPVGENVGGECAGSSAVEAHQLADGVTIEIPERSGHVRLNRVPPVE